MVQHCCEIARFTFYCIPMLNPDGAKSYTRVNANEVDLNRLTKLNSTGKQSLEDCF
jgi:murein tripeptide amidase MpaA